MSGIFSDYVIFKKCMMYLEKVCSVLEIPYEAPTIPKPDLQDKGRCVCCLEALKGHPQFRNKRDALNNKVRTACIVCEKTTCRAEMR